MTVSRDDMTDASADTNGRTPRRPGIPIRVGHHPHGEVTGAGVREVVVFHSTIEELRQYESDLPFLPDPRGQVVAVKYGQHASDQWSVSQLLEHAATARGSDATDPS
jgi:hypothetical protein